MICWQCSGKGRVVRPYGGLSTPYAVAPAWAHEELVCPECAGCGLTYCCNGAALGLDTQPKKED